ncbi:hypothetical protein BDZ90DRAFT_257765 [Jaminaea rosea]|uniref:Uncharacterized protein n=1 Tax=Jaminaea rosea TaxID=1569628 RepID=A0A316UZG5_9BASI|nr:hypothetical protein BDZ90DRAFT_257765 [Jaminaea rosea]PWN30697.1 hypothetical protein BDZ90DRAFT_257765 [Jaminaea rosea]
MPPRKSRDAAAKELWDAGVALSRSRAETQRLASIRGGLESSWEEVYGCKIPARPDVARRYIDPENYAGAVAQPEPTITAPVIPSSAAAQQPPLISSLLSISSSSISSSHRSSLSSNSISKSLR